VSRDKKQKEEVSNIINHITNGDKLDNFQIKAAKVKEIVIGFLSYQRPQLLRNALMSFKKYFVSDNVSFKYVIYDNGSDLKNLVKINLIAKEYNACLIDSGKVYPVPKTHSERDKRCSNGHTKLANLLAEHDASAYLIHEDDWECIGYAPIYEIIKYLEENQHWGQLRLRKCSYNNSLRDCANYNFVTQENLSWHSSRHICNVKVRAANLHWTNNPSIILRPLLEIICKGFNSEFELMTEVNKTYPENLQMFPGIFAHKGPWRNRTDLIEKKILRSVTS